jgi:alkyl hydroperoxide reductase subunit AhpC
MRYALNTVTLFFLISSGVSAQIAGQPPAQTIPEFKFFRFNNSSFTDKDLPAGKMVFLLFFDSDCDHCQNAIKNIGNEYQSFKKIPVFLISIDDQNKINHFMDTYGSKLKGQKNVTILQDKLHQFISKFNPIRYPSLFLYSPEKKLVDYEDNPESVFRLVNSINNAGK